MPRRKIKNIVPEGYVFSQPYEITITYDDHYWQDPFWRVDIKGWITGYRYKTKKDAVIDGQNRCYEIDLRKIAQDANPPETFTIPPIRKF